MNRLAPTGLVLAAVFVVTAAAHGQGGRPASIEPGELTRRADLVGKAVVVDDRVARFQYHPETRAFDQLFLKRCPDVPFDLPASLRYQTNPQPPAVIVHGVLRRDGGGFRCEVTKVELQSADLDRLNHAVATLPRSDFENRNGWARWGERRGEAFKDDVLLNRAREIEAEAIRAEAERPDHDPAGHAIALATRAREHKLPEPEPSALAHKGFRAALSAATSPDDLSALIGRVEAFFPDAKNPVKSVAADLARWERPYAQDPADAYRSASEPARRVFDHRLRADAVQKQIERKAADRPGSEITLAEEAAERLPDRPQLASGLLEKGLGRAEKDVGSLRQSEVELLSAMIKDKLGQPDRAKALFRAWLDDQRDHRLSPGDAEGRLALAKQYEKFLDDRAGALALLRAAWAIDPESRELSDAFLRRGLKKVGGEWVESSQAGPSDAGPARGSAVAPGAAEAEAATAKPRAGRSDSLLNLTPEQVKAQLGGKPNRRSWSFSQGQVMEQWVYVLPGKSQYINFLHKPGDTHPRVVSRYLVPRSSLEPSPGS